tara:strand:- start:44644 stop:44958 length:315 start_codon:yes stop_codon:yes gene_type:complete
MNHGDPNSIRIMGKPIEQLTHAQRVDVMKQKQTAERKQQLDGILSQYPKYDIVQLEAAVRQMDGNIKQLQATQILEHNKIKEYRVHISQCEARDKRLKAAGFEV